VRLPFTSPIAPMLSRAADGLPEGEGWQFEPKWDGFRTLVFRDDDEILLQSRDERPMNRYFPELIEPLRAALPARCVLDGEIVIGGNGSSGRLPPRSRRCISRRRRAIAPSRGTGSADSRAPGSTASWPSASMSPTAPASEP